MKGGGGGVLEAETRDGAEKAFHSGNEGDKAVNYYFTLPRLGIKLQH